MAKIFLDTNYFIDALHRKPEKHILEPLEGNKIFISPLSIHIYCYIFKLTMKNATLISQLDPFHIVDLSDSIITNSLQGPTKDFEDNIQLHSCAYAQCDIFLTEDKKLLSMKFFGTTKMLPTLSAK